MSEDDVVSSAPSPADDLPTDPAFSRLLEKLHAEHSFDFRQYKPTSLARRIRVRLQQVHIDSYDDYLTYLDQHPAEHSALINTILINVTGFLRDPEAWKVLGSDIIPRVVEAAGESRTLRIWSAGCSSGEEAYSLVMVLAEHLGSRADDYTVKIYATDIDDEALATARHGVYRVEDLKDVPAAFLTKYFLREGQTYRFRRDLRRWCIFGRHNIVQDPPMSHIDLLACRNVLIYFTASLQERILARFRYALREDGYLFLGRAESLLARSRWFAPVHVKWRVFQRTTAPAPIAAALPVRVDPVTEDRPVDGRPVGLRLHRLLHALPSAVILIDAADTVLVWNPAAESLFEIAEDSAVGRKFRDLDVSYRVEGLRARVEEVKASHIPARVDYVSFTRRSGSPAHVDLTLVPVIEDERLTAVAVYGTDATESAQMKEQMARVTEQHAAAVEELQSTNEELETTNEELQSTNEELETTNEELQSTNEELETTVQELQSTNDELANVNSEIARRTTGQREVDAYQQAVMSSFAAVIVLDVEGRITTWSEGAQGLWGLPAGDAIGRAFWTLPVGDAAQTIREAFARATSSGRPETITAIPFTLPRTRELRMLGMQFTPLRDQTGAVIGAVGLVLQDDSR